MAEVVGNESMTVLVLSGQESAALADVLTWAGQYYALTGLHELMDAFGIPDGEGN